MKLVTQDQTNVKKIICAMIVSTDFVRQYFNLFHSNRIFKDDIGLRLVESWALDYYTKYDTAINKNIKVIYDEEVRKKSITPEELSIVEKVLIAVSKEFDSGSDKTIETSFLVDLAIEEANKKNFKRITDELNAAIDRSDTARAKEIIESYRAIENKEVPYVDMINNDKFLNEKLFEENRKDIIAFDGDIGKAFQGLFTRSALVLIRGTAKSKKSRMLNMLATQALIQKKKVAMFQLGDLTDADVVQRYLCSISHKPIKAYDKPVSVPFLTCYRSMYCDCCNINCLSKELYKNRDGSINNAYKPCLWCKEDNRPFPYAIGYREEQRNKIIQKDDADKYIQAIREHVGTEGGFRMLNYSSNTFSATDIKNVLKRWAEEGWLADVVVIDSENLQAPDPGFHNKPIYEVVAERFTIYNQIRKEFDCCLLIGDQTRGRGISDENGLMSSEAYSSSQDKNRFCTAVIELNVGGMYSEPKVQVISVSYARNGSYLAESGTFLLMLQDLSVENMCLDSYVPSVESIKLRDQFKKEHGIDN